MSLASCDAVKENDYNEKERRYGYVSGLSCAVIFFLFGLPVWWHTTTVYRAELPYNDIQHAYQRRPVVRGQFEVILALPGIDPVTVSKLGEALRDVNDLGMMDDYVLISYRGNVRVISDKDYASIESAKTLTELDNIELNTGGKYQIYIVKTLPDNLTAYLSKRRQIFLTAPKDVKELPTLLPNITGIFKELYQQESLSHTFQAARGVPLNDKELLRANRFDSAYSIVFSLLVPQPSVVVGTWDVSTAIQELLFDFQLEMSKYVNLKFKSQVLYHETINVKHSTGKENHLPLESLPHIINPIESRLNSFVDTSPTLNFIVYIPTEQEFPLYLHDSTGQRIHGNAFLVPRWGGFMLYNINTTSANPPVLHKVDMPEVLRTFLPQLKLLLGFSDISDEWITKAKKVSSALELWELDQWMRKKTVENIGTSTQALYSLSQLVQSIRNMIINDEIGQLVKDSVAAVLESHEYLSKGSTSEAYFASKKAVQCAEKAFFDPSLLELLYFPEDQKFAIYIPLFLPVGIPLVLSAMTALKWFKSRGSPSKTTKAKTE